VAEPPERLGGAGIRKYSHTGCWVLWTWVGASLKNQRQPKAFVLKMFRLRKPQRSLPRMTQIPRKTVAWL